VRPLFLLVALLPLAGCKVSASANVNAGGSSEKRDPVPPPSQEATVHHDSARTSFIGVTHALELSEEASAKAACQCMAAAVGGPKDSAFQWRGTPPEVGDDALVIAIGNEKSSCSGQGTFRGPSIQGVEADGSNVIVYLEEPRPGVPVARGAVFRRPPGEGFLVFRPGRRLPYGQPLPGSGSSVCRLPLGENTAAHPAEATTAPARRGPNPPVNTY
jgi:hypothetical protein